MNLYLALQADEIRYMLGWLAGAMLCGFVLTLLAWINEDLPKQQGRIWIAACIVWLAGFVAVLAVVALIPTTAHALRLIGAE